MRDVLPAFAFAFDVGGNGEWLKIEKKRKIAKMVDSEIFF
jgi:hypothetical protein